VTYVFAKETDMKKQFLTLLTVVLLMFAFTGCKGARESKGPVTLNVFAAASMTETLTEIGAMYMETNPSVTLNFNFDSSGTLKTQIVEGAQCDIFISAAEKQMNQLDISSDSDFNPDGLDYILEGTRFDLLENKVALAVSSSNKAYINSYDDMVAALNDGSLFMAIGNEDVPVGQYTRKIFNFYSLDEDSLAENGQLTYGSNVKEVTTQISEETVDCGIIYQTDAYSANLTVVDVATEEMCGQVIYPAAVLNSCENQEAAKAFLEYLKTEASSRVFEKVGFTPLNR